MKMSTAVLRHLPSVVYLLGVLCLKGEDVSMGIWLTAVKPNYIDVSLWCLSRFNVVILVIDCSARCLCFKLLCLQCLHCW